MNLNNLSVDEIINYYHNGMIGECRCFYASPYR